MLKVWNVALVGGTFALCLFGTFLTRSGILDSIHAFVTEGNQIAWAFTALIVVMIGASVWLVTTRRTGNCHGLRGSQLPNPRAGSSWQDRSAPQSTSCRQIACSPHTAGTRSFRAGSPGAVTSIASEAAKRTEVGCASRNWW